MTGRTWNTSPLSGGILGDEVDVFAGRMLGDEVHVSAVGTLGDEVDVKCVKHVIVYLCWFLFHKAFFSSNHHILKLQFLWPVVSFQKPVTVLFHGSRLTVEFFRQSVVSILMQLLQILRQKKCVHFSKSEQNSGLLRNQNKRKILRNLSRNLKIVIEVLLQILGFLKIVWVTTLR